MAHPVYSTEEIIRRGKTLYKQNLRPQVETCNTGKVLIINVETGEYELDTDHLAASDRAAAKYLAPHFMPCGSGRPPWAVWGRSLLGVPASEDRDTKRAGMNPAPSRFCPSGYCLPRATPPAGTAAGRRRPGYARRQVLPPPAA